MLRLLIFLFTLLRLMIFLIILFGLGMIVILTFGFRAILILIFLGIVILTLTRRRGFAIIAIATTRLAAVISLSWGLVERLGGELIESDSCADSN